MALTARWRAFRSSRYPATMNVLIIGGNRFVGALLAWRLLARGDRVTLFNRGTIPDAFGDRVERIRGDRTTDDLARAVLGRRFDAVVDFAAFTGDDARGAVAALGGRVGHYVLVSTGSVYVVREGCPRPSREADYEGPVTACPLDAFDAESWQYGVGKRAAEDALVEAYRAARFPSTRLRIPVVNGERDYHRRAEGYLFRILDGGPVIVPDGGEVVVRHVYGLDVAIAIARILGDERAFGQAYNCCQDETPTIWDLVGMLADRLGAPDRRVALPSAALGDLPLQDVSPYSGRGMSLLDPARARAELGLAHRPLAAYLDAIVASFLAHPPPAPPEGYRRRDEERRLA
jgi:nucleoside-diphosphate-sugar epimerase